MASNTTGNKIQTTEAFWVIPNNINEAFIIFYLKIKKI